MEERITARLKPAMEAEFESFENKVEEIGAIVRELCSKDELKAQKACMKADLYLMETKEFDENKIKIKYNRTLINKNCKSEDPGTMGKDAFMAAVEKDAKERAENRRRRYEIADKFKKSAHKYFEDGDYVKAVDLYSKAISEVKDCTTLYVNRAVTYLKLGLHKRMIEDCDWALKVDDNCMRAWLLKARASYELGKVDEADTCIQEAIQRNPDKKNDIDIYVAQWRWRDQAIE